MLIGGRSVSLNSRATLTGTGKKKRVLREDEQPILWGCVMRCDRMKGTRRVAPFLRVEAVQHSVPVIVITVMNDYANMEKQGSNNFGDTKAGDRGNGGMSD